MGADFNSFFIRGGWEDLEVDEKMVGLEGERCVIPTFIFSGRDAAHPL